MKQALEELQFYCTDGGITVLGSYPVNRAEQPRYQRIKEAEKLVYAHISSIIRSGRLGGRMVRIALGPRKQPQSAPSGSSSLSCLTT